MGKKIILADPGPGTPMVTSWYADPSGTLDTFHGKLTASGSVMDGTASMGLSIPTGAHKSLPFGTILCLVHKANSQLIKISDRGPYSRGRQLDISWWAARNLDLLHKGVSTVHVKVLYNPGQPSPSLSGSPPDRETRRPKDLRRQCKSFLKFYIKNKK